MSNIIGISAFFHDSSCCLLQDGELVCAAEEERFSRIKHDARLPWQAFRYCLRQGGIEITDVDCIAYYENPTKKLARQIWTGIVDDGSRYMRERALAAIARTPVEDSIRQGLGYNGPFEIVDHHLSHAASSFFYSGFDESATMTVDGMGEWASTTYGKAEGKDISIFEEVVFPNSLGMLYATITAFLGFKVNSGEYKVMGLGPYGRPTYVGALSKLIQSGSRGQYKIDPSYFEFASSERMYSDKLVDLLGNPPRKPESELTRFHFDLACSVQVVLEDVLLEKVRWLHQEVPSDHLCMAGGVALNCVANHRIMTEGPYAQLFIQPAATDAGGALGAAAVAYTRMFDRRPSQQRLEHVYLGPGYGTDEVRELLLGSGVNGLDFRHDEAALLEEVVTRLVEGKVIGWFQGRMEFGPRALGARSILADPRRADMRDRINAHVKMREAFRPFAPAVLVDHAKDHFDMDHASPFMLETCQVVSTLSLPAVTHVDGSARIQTVSRKTSPRYAALLQRFNERTGCPMLLNTSFNMRGEPIVCTPTNALSAFVRSAIDTLVLEDFIVEREMIPPLWELAVSSMGMPKRSGINHDVYTLF